MTASSPASSFAPTTCAEIVGDDPGIVDARLEKQALADRVDRDLEDPRESVPFPGIERKVVVADLELGRIEIAEVFELVVQAAAPAAVRSRRSPPARTPSSRGSGGRVPG